MASPDDIHEFELVAVAPAIDDHLDGIALMLTEKRGGKVRLHMPLDLAEQLREKVSAAIDRRNGP